MAKQLFANNASALLAASISDTDLTIQVASGYGALYPNPGADEFFTVALENADGDIEFVKITSRTTDLLTVPIGGRGQDGTTALAWTNGQTRVEARLHKSIMERFIQREGDVMSGDLDMDDNEIQNVRITGDWVGDGGVLAGTAIRGDESDGSNEILVPDDGTRATAGGEKILVETDQDEIKAAAFDVGMIMLWFGAEVDVPDGWAICNGSGGTPDMRGRLALGVDGSHALNSSGGSFSATSSADGEHTHTGTVDEHVLTTDEIPAHSHQILGAGSLGSGPGLLFGVVNGLYKTSELTGGGLGHSHDLSGVSTEPEHTHTVDTTPPYRALHYIMFTG